MFPRRCLVVLTIVLAVPLCFVKSSDPCDGYCQNGGQCSAPADAPMCSCPHGFIGERCEAYDDEIHSGSCPQTDENSVGICGGTFCISDGNCSSEEKCCVSACGSKLCTKSVIYRDPCIIFTCENGGTCKSPLDAPFCTCAPGFGGDHCEKNVKMGRCPPVNQSSEVGLCAMTCSSDYDCNNTAKCCANACGGTYCEDEIIMDPCDGYCQNGGQCSTPADAPVCSCPHGFIGERCEAYDDDIHSGSCPQTDENSVGICGGTFCISDGNCSSEEKCCRSACGSKLCTKSVTDVHPTPPPLTCSNMLCARDKLCRPVVSCPTCPLQYKCIDQTHVQNVTDSQCQKENYAQVILLEQANDTVTYDQLTCDPATDDLQCPATSLCVHGGSCCRGFMGTTNKPGSCPSVNVSCSGGASCGSDDDCQGAKKCCASCEFTCTDPVSEDLCGNIQCAEGEVCVDRQRPCTMDVCIQALAPTCVPAECGQCPYNQDCRKQDSGYECVDYDQCGGCSDGQVCKNTGIVCVRAPCPTYQCVPMDECGGCLDGHVCKNTGIVCVRAPCPTYQCVPMDECGGCLNGQVCKETGIECITTPCPTHECVTTDECGGCLDGQVCKETGIKCITTPCPTHECVPMDECGGCLDGEFCRYTGIICIQAPCPTYQCTRVDQCGGCHYGEVCVQLASPCSNSSCSSFQCVSETACPLRCPADSECVFQVMACRDNDPDCTPSFVPKCQRIKPELSECPQAGPYLSPDSLLCSQEMFSYPNRCHGDAECGPDQRCCSSSCGIKRCSKVHWRTFGMEGI